MKYYSETLHKLFDSEDELIKEEKAKKEAELKKQEAEKAKKAERATRAKEVEKALKEANESQAKAIKMLKDFTNDYGYFHMSYSTEDTDKAYTKSSVKSDFFDLLNAFLQ